MLPGLAFCQLSSCSTPGARCEIRSVAGGHGKSPEVVFEVKTKGCWSPFVGCHGLYRLAVRDARLPLESEERMWVIELPGIRSGTITYGRMPKPEALVQAKEDYDMAELSDPKNPGRRQAKPLQPRVPYSVWIGASHDSPFPSASHHQFLFRINEDGSVSKLRKLPKF